MKRIIYILLLTSLLAGLTCDLPVFNNANPENPNPNQNPNQPIKGINAPPPSGSPIPEIGVPVSIRIINQSDEAATVLVRFFIGDLQVRRTQLQVPANTTQPTIGPDLAAAIQITGTYASGGDTPSAVLILGHDFESGDTKDYIIPDLVIDNCPNDPNKLAPGTCGCGTPDTNSDGDALPDCLDQCPQDPLKTGPGACGCGHPDTDANNNGIADCNDTEPPPPPPPPPPPDCNHNNKPDDQDIADGQSSPEESRGLTVLAAQGSSSLGGPVLIGGDDADDHGSFDSENGVNLNGWFYIQEGFNNIGAAVANGNKSVVCLGAKTGNATNAFISGFDYSNLPSLGWTRTILSGPTAIANFFNGIGQTTIANTGMIYMPSDDINIAGGISPNEVAVLNTHADAINNFVSNGGGLFTHVQGHIKGGYAWLTKLVPGLNVDDGDGCQLGILTLTDDGKAAFPNLTDDLASRAAPWHDHFSGDIGGLSVLITGLCGETEQPVIIGGAQVQIQQTITLNPIAQTRPKRTPHTLFATVAGSGPVINAQVTFEITSGPNAGAQGQAFTDNNGVAQFTYVGSLVEGTDHAIASFDDGNLHHSNEVTVTWHGSADCNGNGIPDECETDTDEDGVIDDCDNCPHVANSDQADDNGNGIGNVCDFVED